MDGEMVADVVRRVMDASEVMLDYHCGRICEGEALDLLERLDAMRWTECGSPWSEYGAFICERCVASDLENLVD